ncbi:MAG: YceI family protein [Bacteroidetes bacterium]|nr:YceI family protein [Bacteroidota bacterium]
MKKFLPIVLVVSAIQMSAQTFKSTSSKISFFSKTPVENISAVNTTSQSAIDTKKKSILVLVKVIAFKFEKPLMEEHFNEKYLETDKFADAVFKGTITNPIDFTKDGVYTVKAEGNFTMHGVTKAQKFEGTLEIKKGKMILHCKFNVKLADYKIEVPSVVTEKIAETIEVDVNFTYEPYKKS